MSEIAQPDSMWQSQSLKERPVLIARVDGISTLSICRSVPLGSCSRVALEGCIAMSVITLTVNGQRHTMDLDPTTPLLYVLSDDLGLRGPKYGCGLGQCGSCTAIVNGRAERTCVTPVNLVADATIITLEGLGTPEELHPLQRAFIDEQAAQCGFCLSGVMLTAKALLDQNPEATDSEIQRELRTVLCRCFTQTRMLRAIRRYAQGRA